MTVVEKNMTVQNQNGVHGRVATKLAVLARREGIVLQLLHDGGFIDCSSVLDVLSMAFSRGSRFRVRIEGDEKEVQDVLRCLEELFAGETVP